LAYYWAQGFPFQLLNHTLAKSQAFRCFELYMVHLEFTTPSPKHKPDTILIITGKKKKCRRFS
jgi:hypothetical protein